MLKKSVKNICRERVCRRRTIMIQDPSKSLLNKYKQIDVLQISTPMLIVFIETARFKVLPLEKRLLIENQRVLCYNVCGIKNILSSISLLNLSYQSKP